MKNVVAFPHLCPPFPAPGIQGYITSGLQRFQRRQGNSSIIYFTIFGMRIFFVCVCIQVLGGTVAGCMLLGYYLPKSCSHCLAGYRNIFSCPPQMINLNNLACQKRAPVATSWTCLAVTAWDNKALSTQKEGFGTQRVIISSLPVSHAHWCPC